MAPRDLFQPPPHAERSPLAALVSLLVHGAAVAGLVWLAFTPATRRAFKSPERLTFLPATVSPVDMVESLRKARPLQIPAPKPQPDPETRAELQRPLELPVSQPPTPPLPTVPDPPLAKRSVAKVGEFAAGLTPTPRVVQRQVQAVGFETQPAVAPGIQAGVAASIGTFESREIKDARPGTDRPGTVEASGFESGQMRSAGTSTSRAVANSGFGSVPAAQTQTAATPQTVKAAGFSDAAPAPAATVRQTAQVQVTPVEVLFKPTPGYSAEARAQKIEGAVTLEVEFSATGRVRVLRLIRGLGHGLDEMAMRAAEQIQFKPALSAGKPVDFTASVQIIFHLT